MHMILHLNKNISNFYTHSDNLLMLKIKRDYYLRLLLRNLVDD